MPERAIYSKMSLKDLYQAFKVQDELYLNALRTGADADLIKQIGREMDIILDTIKNGIREQADVFRDKYSSFDQLPKSSG